MLREAISRKGFLVLLRQISRLRIRSRGAEVRELNDN